MFRFNPDRDRCADILNRQPRASRDICQGGLRLFTAIWSLGHLPKQHAKQGRELSVREATRCSRWERTFNGLTFGQRLSGKFRAAHRPQ
jgi:hypothetical protein